MTRPYHSPSSQKLGDRCARAWAYCYLDGLRSPDTEANRVGLAIHAAFEAYWGDPDPTGGPIAPGKVGQIVLDGLRHLPPKGECFPSEVERAIGQTRIPGVAPDARVTIGCYVNGVIWAGFRDLRIQGLSGPVRTVDYKSCGSFRYMLDPPGLARDLQGCIYAHDDCNSLLLPEAHLRWLYLATGPRRESRPVDAVIPATQALDVVSRASERARKLDLIPDSASAPCNPAACGDYGGCYYHHDRGGPCHPPVDNAQKRGKPMSSATATQKIAELRARFEAKKAAAAAEVEAEEPEEAVEDPGGIAHDLEGENDDAPEVEVVIEAPKPKPRAAVLPGRVIGGKSAVKAIEADTVDAARYALTATAAPAAAALPAPHVDDLGPEPPVAGNLADEIANQLGRMKSAEAVIVQCKRRLRGLLA